jgi:hypothetical protein
MCNKFCKYFQVPNDYDKWEKPLFLPPTSEPIESAMSISPESSHESLPEFILPLAGKSGAGNGEEKEKK